MYIFSETPLTQPERLQTQFRAEDSAIAGMVEKICSRPVAHIPGANIKEFWLTILNEAERPQNQCLSPQGEF